MITPITLQTARKLGKSILLPLIYVALGSVIGIYGWTLREGQPNQRISTFYEDEMAVAVSPVTIRKLIDKKDANYILVDLRSKKEYDTEHIVTAVNVPAVSLNADQIVAQFRLLPKDKQIIVHCYSAYCTLGREIGRLLSRNGIYVKEMNIGWSEWKYYWALWNPGDDPKNGIPYVVATPVSSDTKDSLITPCTQGQFGC